ncbi:MAG: deoxyribonuclease IV [Caldisericaceae bacterium]
MILGAHVSIAGGISNAPVNAHDATCDTIQIFTKNQMQWKVPPLNREEIRLFKQRMKKYRIASGTVHSSYLVNIASANEEIRSRSIEDLARELERADELGIPYVVFHPGAHKGMGEKEGLNKVGISIKEIVNASKSRKSLLLLETTAGEGTTLGYTFEQLAEILHIAGESRIGVCLDTCHIFAAGYDIRDEKSYNTTMSSFDRTIGLKFLKAIHLNDSKRELGSRMDRHEEIGLGKIGVKAFSLFVNDERLSNIPGILETPGGIEGYKKNLNILRGLIKR